MSRTENPQPTPTKRTFLHLAIIGFAGAVLSVTGIASASQEPAKRPIPTQQAVEQSAAFQPGMAHLWEPPTTTTTATPPTTHHHHAPRRVTAQAQAPAQEYAPASDGRCGGDLPPCSVMMCESGGDIRAQNSSSTASGKWQFLSSSWNGYGGYPEAYLAPESVQDDLARIFWDGGNGSSHWAQCL